MASVLNLVLDLSCAGFVAALDAEGKVLSRRWRSASVRNDDIAAWVQECLEEAGGGFSGLDGIAVGIGPGSFTGIRIAMAFAQGLAFPRNLPLHGFTSLSALCLSAPAAIQGRVVSAIPANAGRFYAAGSDTPEALMDADGLRRLGGGTVCLAVHEEFPGWDGVRPAFAQVVEIRERMDAAAIFRQAQKSGLGALKPQYLQLPAAENRMAEP